MASQGYMVEIFELTQPCELREQLLRERAERAKAVRTRQFVALRDKREIGYLSFDDRSEIKVGVLYEILVLPQFRQQGVGSQLIIFAEKLARSVGCQRIRLSPKAFDQSVSQNWLESWYEKHGYCIARDGSQEFEKYLA